MHKSRGFGGNNGDWICPSPKCSNLNFARRSVCNRCGEERPFQANLSKKAVEIGKSAAEKSKGLFSAEDWQCSKCGNVNWARRNSCNVCNAPKVAEVEERTGFGGGFNEREGVEYIDRDDSENEFDDFGRRKKKFRSNERQQSTEKEKSVSTDKDRSSNTAKLENNEEEKEQEDDEGDEDEDDLSKYDLSGWGDDDGEAKPSPAADTSPPPARGNRRRRHSASSSSSSRSSTSSRSRDRKRSRRTSSSSSDENSSDRSRSSSSSSSSSRSSSVSGGVSPRERGVRGSAVEKHRRSDSHRDRSREKR